MNTVANQQPTRSTHRSHQRLYVHAWTGAASLAALALTLIETAGYKNP